MNPAKVNRNRLDKLTDLPNIGPACVRDLAVLGIRKPADLRGKSAYKLYDRLCEATGMRHDPCMLDTFISVVRFIDGEPPRAWWEFTEERKQALIDNPRASKFA